jgi:hypothetical protein
MQITATSSSRKSFIKFRQKPYNKFWRVVYNSFWRKAPAAELTRGIISPERKLVVLHTPKCGGTSLLASLEAAFGRDQVYRDYKHGGKRGRAATSEDIERPIIYGHFQAIKYQHLKSAMRVTMLREPMDRVMSLYFNWRFTPGKILTHYPSRLRRRVFGGQISLLEFAQIPGIADAFSDRFFAGFDMKRFDLIIVHDNYNEGVERLGEKLGVPLSVESRNVSSSRSKAYEDARRSVTGDPVMMRELREILRADIEFFQRCLELPSAIVAKTKPQIPQSSKANIANLS